ncbi:hypothetical protein GGX14DRAFT_397655 [Mycena pura]|uniref:Uncharacterized protein n=1 Tax=Mycena pura TaxID=153505 RepID=A0AAD6YAF3_9AGAR|nr:hypothetical protein GGX14DRAFT_397655 [Mycena pura]
MSTIPNPRELTSRQRRRATTGLANDSEPNNPSFHTQFNYSHGLFPIRHKPKTGLANEPYNPSFHTRFDYSHGLFPIRHKPKRAWHRQRRRATTGLANDSEPNNPSFHTRFNYSHGLFPIRHKQKRAWQMSRITLQPSTSGRWPPEVLSKKEEMSTIPNSRELTFRQRRRATTGLANEPNNPCLHTRLTSDRQSSAATDDVEDEFALMEKQRAAKRAHLEALRMRDDGQGAS